MSYQAYIAKIKVRPMENADRLQIGQVGGYQVIVGKDIQDGQLVCMFDADGRLSEEFCEKNDLVRRKDENGNTCGGMFDPNRKVRAIKLRGVKSDGFACPLSYFSYTGMSEDDFSDGMTFSELNGHEICTKYVTEATQKAINNCQKTVKYNKAKLLTVFPEHETTSHWQRCYQAIPVGSILYVSEKCHGTSGRFGHIKVSEHKYPRILDFSAKISNRLAGFLNQKLPKDVYWGHINGTRRVNLIHPRNNSYYPEGDKFRYDATANILLPKGQIIYFELVNQTHTGRYIMPPHSPEGLKDKNLIKRLGKQFHYTYGCQPNECKLFVYRITQTNEDGYVVDLSWPQVEKRCAELGLLTVPHLDRIVFDGDYEALDKYINSLVNGDDEIITSTLDDKHLMEGVVIRVESKDRDTYWLKNKSFLFKLLEQGAKDDITMLDMEEAS